MQGRRSAPAAWALRPRRDGPEAGMPLGVQRLVVDRPSIGCPVAQQRCRLDAPGRRCSTSRRGAPPPGEITQSPVFRTYTIERPSGDQRASWPPSLVSCRGAPSGRRHPARRRRARTVRCDRSGTPDGCPSGAQSGNRWLPESAATRARRPAIHRHHEEPAAALRGSRSRRSREPSGDHEGMKSSPESADSGSGSPPDSGTR